jgi:hypothetical protein
MPRFQKKPVVIEARYWDGSDESTQEILEWADGDIRFTDDNGEPWLVVLTLEGTHRIEPGYWVICGVQGEFYGCDPGIFEQTYQEVSEVETEVSDRGFTFTKEIVTAYGEKVSAYESSAAMAPHIWVSIEGEAHLDEKPRPYAGFEYGLAAGSIAAHMTLEQVDQLIANLIHLRNNHYHLS